MSDEKYPEHMKLRAVSDYSQAIGEFLEWLSAERIELMRWQTWTEDDICPLLSCHEGFTYKGEPCSNCNGKGTVERQREDWMHDRRSINRLLADYFDIDLDKIDDEKRAMLDEIRAASKEMPRA